MSIVDQRVVSAPPRSVQVRAMLITPSYAAICVFVLLASPATLPPSMSALAALAALACAVGALFGYNNYLGRNDDAISRKRATRPLAGFGDRMPFAELTLVVQVLLALGLPLVVGSTPQFIAHAATFVIYAAAFHMRTSIGRIAAIAKTASATTAAAFPSLGTLLALDTDPLWAGFVITVIAVWRATFEVACDGKDLVADLANRRSTPVVVWGRAALRTTTHLSLICLLAAMAVAFEAFTAIAAALAVGAVATLIAIATRHYGLEGNAYWSQTRSLTIAFLALGGASALAVSRGVLWALAFAAFMLLLADRSELRRALAQPFPHSSLPEPS